MKFKYDQIQLIQNYIKIFNLYIYFFQFPLEKFLKNIKLLKKSCLFLNFKQLFFSNLMFLRNFSKGNLMTLVGIMGGASYVNVFYLLLRDPKFMITKGNWPSILLR